MEQTAEIKQYARLILEELKQKYEELPSLNRRDQQDYVREVVDLETDNPDLENLSVSLKIDYDLQLKNLRYMLKVQSNTIQEDTSSCEWFWFVINGIPYWNGKVSWDAITLSEDIVDEIAKHIILASENAESLIFDKYNERFISRTCAKSMRNYTKDSLRRSIFSNKKSFQDSICSVCHDPTRTETPCGHHLCLVCWEKLQQKTCPCCRCNIECRAVNDE